MIEYTIRSYGFPFFWHYALYYSLKGKSFGQRLSITCGNLWRGNVSCRCRLRRDPDSRGCEEYLRLSLSAQESALQHPPEDI